MARGATLRDPGRDPGRLRLLRERPRDDAAVEAMNEAAFGPDRQHKTVYRLREDVKPIKELCFVAIDQKGRMVASIRNWPIQVNERWPAILLGPLAIAPELRGLGYGKALMWHSMAQARPAAPAGAAFRTSMSRDGAITPPRKPAAVIAAVSQIAGSVTVAITSTMAALRAKQAAATWP